MEKLKTLEITDVEFHFDINLEKYTTIKLADQGNLALVKSENGLGDLLRNLSFMDLPYRVVGWGANQVLLNTRDSLFIKLDFPFDRNIFSSEENHFELPASAPLNQLTSIATKFGFKGWDVFTGVPASLGGAICMNAGTSLGEIGELIESVRVMDPKGEISVYKCNKDSFSYRRNNFLKPGEIIVSAIIFHKGIEENLKQKIDEYLSYRKSTQPLTTKNCGSVFKNNPGFPAGKTIDAVGLKGFGFENLSVSLKHGNFIENLGGATAKEFEEIIQVLKLEIERYSGQEFELEVKIY